MVIFPKVKLSAREELREEFSFSVEQMILFFFKYMSDFGLETLTNF